MTQTQHAIQLGAALEGSVGRRRRERVVRGVLTGAGLVSLFVSILIVLTLAFEAFAFISQVDLARLLAPGWFPRRNLYDLPTLFLGTFLVTGIAMLVAGPIGLASAVFLSEYASPRTRRTVKPVLEVLAGIPSIVLGFFALTVINPGFVQALFPDAGGFNILAASLAVGILAIPLVASIAEDAMRSVPASLREAAYGLGARRMTTSLQVVAPAAVSGIVAALILASSRAIGETMVVALAAGATGGGVRNLNPVDPGQTMTAAMASLALGSDQARGADLAFPSLFFVGAVLFVLTLGLNVVGEAFVRRTRQQY